MPYAREFLCAFGCFHASFCMALYIAAHNIACAALPLLIQTPARSTCSHHIIITSSHHHHIITHHHHIFTSHQCHRNAAAAHPRERFIRPRERSTVRTPSPPLHWQSCSININIILHWQSCSINIIHDSIGFLFLFPVGTTLHTLSRLFVCVLRLSRSPCFEFSRTR